jgi:hypothetical protein
LYFGSCRDIFFIIVKLLIKLNNNKNRFNKLNINSSFLKKVRYHSADEFIEDLVKLFEENDRTYEELAIKFYNIYEFRNNYAHRFRILWWHNIKCGVEYFLERDFYNAINN